ncbi:unnamed protein product [Tuber aestivum]|uniref:AB hydrolase-1 domain-containing protein n=1 Tax=Tuber aestivum TaxID=59557 RepID=A0A292PUA8_9PEZI|nr:unnamed protein product [Tuber aestivum]
MSSSKPLTERYPELQSSDVHDAVGHLLSFASVNPDKIWIIGFSYSGAHAVKAASLDRRIKAVISINGFIRGSWLVGILVPDRASSDALIWEDRERRRTGGGEVGYLPLCKTAETGDNVLFPTQDSGEFYLGMQKAGLARGEEWRNEVTMQSLLKMRRCNVMEDLKVLAPTSLLMIVDEVILGCGEHWRAFEAAEAGGEILREFVTVEGGHFAPLTEGKTLERVIEHSLRFLRRAFDGKIDEGVTIP